MTPPELEFTKEDIFSLDTYLKSLTTTDIEDMQDEGRGLVSDYLNRILSEKIAKCPVVYGLGEHEFEIIRRTPAINATHQGYLVGIRKLATDDATDALLKDAFAPEED